MEKRARFIEKCAFDAMVNGYKTGDFSEFIKYLAEDCAIKSDGRVKSVVGREAVKSFYEMKGKWIVNIGATAYLRAERKRGIICGGGNAYYMPARQHDLTGIRKHVLDPYEDYYGIENLRAEIYIRHELDKQGLLFEDPDTVYSYIDLVLNGEGKISRILFLDPRLFNYSESVRIDYAGEI